MAALHTPSCAKTGSTTNIRPALPSRGVRPLHPGPPEPPFGIGSMTAAGPEPFLLDVADALLLLGRALPSPPSPADTPWFAAGYAA